MFKSPKQKHAILIYAPETSLFNITHVPCSKLILLVFILGIAQHLGTTIM
jgi:hypothetical protein